MRTPILLRLVPALTCAAIALTAALPAQARTDWLNQGAPPWVDQTVYRPNCLSADCACECRSPRLCLPSCPRW